MAVIAVMNVGETVEACRQSLSNCRFANQSACPQVPVRAVLKGQSSAKFMMASRSWALNASRIALAVSVEIDSCC